MRQRFVLPVFAGLLAALPAAAETSADLVVTGARIYTADAAHDMAQALAVSKGRIVYVGDEAGVKAFVGPKTKTVAAGGKLVLPGLVDAHIHPTQGIYPLDVCDLHNKPMTLEATVEIVKGCIRRYQVKDGDWLVVEQWNFGAMTSETPGLTVRAALDRASKTVPVYLLGNDYHHGGFNSAALALARNAKGEKIGLSKASLAGEFAAYKKLVGVDSAGEPNGTANEDARQLMTPKGFFSPATFKAVMKIPEKTIETLNADGITAFQEGAVNEKLTVLYDALEKSGKLNARLNLAQLYEPEEYRRADGSIDYDRIVATANKLRAKYAKDPKINTGIIKIFVDGVLEADPLAVPPTLGESPMLKPFLQPIFGRDAEGNATLKGYADTGSAACQDVRAHPEAYESDAAIEAFTAANGHHPGQCAISSGKFQHDRQIILDYAKRMHDEGYTLHLHAIGDAAVRTALDAIEGARASDGVTSQPDTIVHLQVVAPEDIARLGRDHIYAGFTYSWAYADKAYDLSVIPFIDKVADDSYESLHNPENYYEKYGYATLSAKKAGAILVAGSDAPVAERDPQPFVNIAMGITRALPGQKPLNIKEALTIQDLLDAYTINGAKGLGRQAEIGSLETGKSADFVILDQDVIALAESGEAARIAATKVQETWFQGRRVYKAKSAK
jgi:predicted amidohydrolase YtcJ